jgi:hypothetical protein
MPALPRLAAAHPDLRVELIELEAEESLPVLARGGVDIAIAEEYEHAPRPHQPELHRDDLEPDELVLTVPRGLLAGDGPVALGLAARRAVGDRAGRHPLRRHVRARVPRGRLRASRPPPRERHPDAARPGGGRGRRGVAAVARPPRGRPARRGADARRRADLARAVRATRAADRARPSTAAVVDAIRGVP